MYLLNHQNLDIEQAKEVSYYSEYCQQVLFTRHSNERMLYISRVTLTMFVGVVILHIQRSGTTPTNIVRVFLTSYIYFLVVYMLLTFSRTYILNSIGHFLDLALPDLYSLYSLASLVRLLAV